MTDDLAPFESPKELIQGAKENLVQLNAECTAFGMKCPYEFVIRTDNKAGEKVVALRLKCRLPLRVRRLASSIAKECSLALDQAMCDGAVELGRANAKGVYFPWGKNVADLRASRKDKCKRVDRQLVAFALKFKPYYGGDPAFWSFHRLAGQAHQRIIAARPQDRGFLKAAIIDAVGPMSLTINAWNDVHSEMEIARLPFGASLTLNPDAVLTLEVIFGHGGEALAGRPLAATLNTLIGKTETIVLGLEAETARLKAIRP